MYISWTQSVRIRSSLCVIKRLSIKAREGNYVLYQRVLINVAQDRDRQRAIVNAVMNLRVPWIAGNFLTRWELVRVTKRTLLHGVHYEPGHKVEVNVSFMVRQLLLLKRDPGTQWRCVSVGSTACLDMWWRDKYLSFQGTETRAFGPKSLNIFTELPNSQNLY